MAKGIRYGVVTTMTGIACSAIAYNGELAVLFAVAVAIFGGLCAAEAVGD